MPAVVRPAAATGAQPPGSRERVHGEVPIRYSERSVIRVRGAVTGKIYHFSPAQPVQRVDRRDAEKLLGTRFFHVPA